jgi:hypothetical protein
LVFNQTSDHCSGGCGTDAANKVTVSETAVAGKFDIQVQLGTNWQFMGNFDSTFAFALPGITALTFGAVTLTNNPPVAGTVNNQFWSTAWAPNGGFTSASNGATTFNASAAVLGPPPDDLNFSGFGMAWNNGSGQSKADGSFIDFTISNAALTLASFLNTTFFADVFSGKTGLTGLIDFSNPTLVPLPPALLLFGTALAGIGVLARRRSKKSGLAHAA